MTRAIAMIALVGAVMFTATACGDEGLQGVGGSASEVAGRIGDAAAEVGDQLEQGIEEQPAAGAEEQPEQAQEQPAPQEPAPEESATEETATPLWPLALLALAAILLIAFLVASRRRSREAAAQQQRLLDEVLRDVDWLIDASSERPSQVDAASRARDVRVRVDRVSDGLRRLEEVSGRRTAEAAQDVRIAAQALAGAVIDRLDHAAAGRVPASAVDVNTLAERTRLGRDRLIEVG